MLILRALEVAVAIDGSSLFIQYQSAARVTFNHRSRNIIAVWWSLNILE